MTISVHDQLQDLLLLENSLIDKSQMELLSRLRHHIRALWRHVQRLEHVIATNQDELVLKVGAAKLTMKKDGTVSIEGKDIKVRASGRLEVNGQRVSVKGTSTLELKGAKIMEN
ncbi:MAG TPA: hypothetical protein VNM46_12295 [Xanthobacteraceae bacterium]|jgi:membrane-bound ClpP family serine protease|nr:hypothetical protein [Xanthobacteraceae bacterium]